MKTNMVSLNTNVTHEGGKAQPTLSAIKELKRNVATCLLWEPTFYETGNEVAKRISSLCNATNLGDLADLARSARKDWNLRHVPLYLLTQLIAGNNAGPGSVGSMVGNAIFDTVSRPDEITELIAMYWKDGKKPITKQMKLGLGRAFNKFDAYQLAKWNKTDKEVTLRDALFMVHAKPKDDNQAALFKQLVDGTLPTPYTWETELSSGKNKLDAWTGLLISKKLPHMAAVMNARNMLEAGVHTSSVGNYVVTSAFKSKLFPYRYWTAAKNAPEIAGFLEMAAMQAINNVPVLPGKTAILIDVSASMRGALAGKSNAQRWEAAAALGMLIHARSEQSVLAHWAGDGKLIPNIGGFGLMAFADPTNIEKFGIRGGTMLTKSLTTLAPKLGGCDRTIVITDEQSQDGVPNITSGVLGKGYIVNVAPYANGIGADKGWVKIDGWSERVLDYIRESEALDS